MPIKTVATATNPTSAPVLALSLDDETKSKLYTVIEAYLLFNSTPTDEEVHCFATALGMSKEALEAVLYEFFASELQEDASQVDPLEDDVAVSAVSAFALRSGDELGDALENDGVPDQELQGLEDPMKENSESDGAPDTELIRHNIGKD